MSDDNSVVDLLALRNELFISSGIDLGSRSIQIIGDIDENMFRKVETGISLLEDGCRKAITLKINSNGGSPEDAMAIVGRMQASNCQIITEGYGMIASAATLIFVAGNKRKMSEYAKFMTHQCGYELGGKHIEVYRYVMEQEKNERIAAEFMEKFSTKTAEFWYALNKNGKDTYFTAKECLEHGLIEEIF